MPNAVLRITRRAALRAVALLAGAVGAATTVTGCDDSPARNGTPGATESTTGTTVPAPSGDPVVVAALSVAATQVQQQVTRYTATGQRHPALRKQLAVGAGFHASHLARLKQFGAQQPVTAGKLPPAPSASAAALKELAESEQRLSVLHATAAAKVPGQAARLLASIAASESQLARALTPKGSR